MEGFTGERTSSGASLNLNKSFSHSCDVYHIPVSSLGHLFLVAQ